MSQVLQVLSLMTRRQLRPLPALMVGLSVPAFLLWVTVRPSTAQTPPNPVLDIGIVQRFGTDADDELVLEPLTGDRLTVQLQNGGQVETITTNRVTVEVVMEPLDEPVIEERVVLSTHRSFESAEDSANQWRARGIEVEIAQPRQWQVWAKRDVYNTPLLRRLLFQNLQANGASVAFIDTQVKEADAIAAVVMNGFRYHRDEVDISSANSRIRVDSNLDNTNRLYGGDMRLQPNAYGTYTLVNEVPIETYLRGVVPHEIGLAAPPTTIEAQAILARTYVLRNLRRFEIDDYELCADTQCQVYWGLSGADPISDRAIDNTRGLVLTYNNELVDALYSSTTGGVTAAFTDVWNGIDRPYLRSVVDSVQNSWDLDTYRLDNEANFRRFISLESGFNEDDWALFRWREENSLTEIAEDVREYLQSKQHPLATFSQIQGLEVLERSLSGRVQRLRVTTDIGSIDLEKDEVLRALWGPNSTMFYLEPLYQTAATSDNTNAESTAAETRQLRGYAFVGGGFGHGVGMSQTGAYNLGDLGWTSDRILGFYYPGTQVQPLSGNIVFWRDPAELEPDTVQSPPDSLPEAIEVTDPDMEPEAQMEPEEQSRKDVSSGLVIVRSDRYSR
jgi:SpoIID/LytB domain protein